MEDWVVIFTAEKMYKINLVKGLLAENDIQSREISSKNSAFLIGSIDLYVHPDDADKARELIEKNKIV